MSLEIPYARGIYNLDMNDEGNESLDYMFSELSQRKSFFAARAAKESRAQERRAAGISEAPWT